MIIDRRYEIKKLISEQKQISIQEITRRFNISIATARRDLDALADQGILERVHGGAQLVKKAPPEMPTILRSNEQVEEKERIANAMVKMINSGDTLFLGSGTTVMEVARRLPQQYNLTVITNSLLVADVLASRVDINLVIMGGTFRHTENSMYGHIVEQALNEVRADKVIFGIRAISLENGLTNDFLPEITTDRAILKIAREVILVADHTKFDRVSTAMVCPLTGVTRIITDLGTPEKTIQAICDMGVNVTIA